jgi:hypothetical protein
VVTPTPNGPRSARSFSVVSNSGLDGAGIAVVVVDVVVAAGNVVIVGGAVDVVVEVSAGMVVDSLSAVAESVLEPQAESTARRSDEAMNFRVTSSSCQQFVGCVRRCVRAGTRNDRRIPSRPWVPLPNPLVMLGCNALPSPTVSTSR